MRNLSTGDPSTLGSYRKLSVLAFGEDSEPVKFIDEKIKNSPNGENEEVIADERQMLAVLTSLYLEPKSNER